MMTKRRHRVGEVGRVYLKIGRRACFRRCGASPGGRAQMVVSCAAEEDISMARALNGGPRDAAGGSGAGTDTWRRGEVESRSRSRRWR